MHRLATPFNPPPEGAAVLFFDAAGDLCRVRDFVCECAQRAGLSVERLPALRVAISEVATNVLRHTSAGGTLRVWAEQDAFISELTDSGTFAPPSGSSDASGGWGLRLVEQACDRVDLYSRPGENVWRLVLNLDGCT